MWVYIDGIVKIDTYAGTDSTADYVASKLLEHLPQQHGVRTVPVNGGRDNCFMYEHGNRIACNSIRTILIDGAMDGSSFDETLRAFARWLFRLANRAAVSYVLVEIQDELGRSYVLDDADLLALYEPVWTQELMTGRLPANDWKTTRALHFQGRSADDDGITILYDADSGCDG